ncbi:hypothetical protein TUMEXPCC7403_16935 [Tumidithrix helvetica PCC 7403]|uniref:hypothetical protein n=1 Tax=Tumidithrix helvetica TaxID=3457545 RepID=UPI003CA7D7BB
MESRDDLSQDAKSIAGKALMLADALEQIAGNLNNYIVAMRGDRADWGNNAGLHLGREEYGVFADLWNAREEANSVLHWISQTTEEDAIEYLIDHE